MELKRMFAFMVVFLLLASGLSLMTADAGSTYNNPPDPPVIAGPTSGSIYISHKWKESGNYAVKARVMDIYWEWSDWSTLEVSMPKAYHGIWSFMEKINGWFTSITGRSMMPVWGK